MTRRLVLSQASADFDPEHDIPFGPWIFSSAEEVQANWDEQTFPEPFTSVDAYAEADRLTRGLANALVPIWGTRLNEGHSVAHDRHYWRITLLPWLLPAVQALWYRFCHTQAIAAHLGAVPLNVALAPEDVSWNFSGCDDFFANGLLQPGFDFWMSSLTVRALGPESWRLLEEPLPSHQPKPDRRLEQESRLGRLARLLLGRMSCDWVPGVRKGRLLLTLYINAATPRRQAVNHYGEPDAAFFDAFPKPFLDLLERFLHATLPSAFKADYAAHERTAAARSYKPGRLFIGNIRPTDEVERLTLAWAVEKGERLVCLQHGSSCGYARTMPWGQEVEYAYHAFLTWGWREQKGLAGRFIPLPAPALARIKNAHAEREASLIVIGTRVFLRGSRFHAYPRPNQWLDYRGWKARFLDHLPERLRSAILFRPYGRAHSDLDETDYLRARGHDLPLLEGDLDERLLSCRLLIMDHPGSTLNTAMAANVPTIAFWDPEAWPLCDSAKPDFEALENAGILFRTPEDAARQTNAVWNDVAAWWQSPSVQAARKQWCAQYAWAERFWWPRWLLALRRL
jgi:putative transferase (TIGR04331 family)